MKKIFLNFQPFQNSFNFLIKFTRNFHAIKQTDFNAIVDYVIKIF